MRCLSLDLSNIPLRRPKKKKKKKRFLLNLLLKDRSFSFLEFFTQVFFKLWSLILKYGYCLFLKTFWLYKCTYFQAYFQNTWQVIFSHLLWAIQTQVPLMFLIVTIMSIPYYFSSTHLQFYFLLVIILIIFFSSNVKLRTLGTLISFSQGDRLTIAYS